MGYFRNTYTIHRGGLFTTTTTTTTITTTTTTSTTTITTTIATDITTATTTATTTNNNITNATLQKCLITYRFEKNVYLIKFYQKFIIGKNIVFDQ